MSCPYVSPSPLPQKCPILKGHIKWAEVPKIDCGLYDSEVEGEWWLLEYAKGWQTHDTGR